MRIRVEISQFSTKKLLTARRKEKNAELLVVPSSMAISAAVENGERKKSEINVPLKRRRARSEMTSEFVISAAKGAVILRSSEGSEA